MPFKAWQSSCTRADDIEIKLKVERMLERRNSDRVKTQQIWVREENGEYLFSYAAKDLSEEGIFLDKRTVSPSQEPFSKFTFSLPDGSFLRNITGRVVREEKRQGAAIQFLNISEDVRMILKKFIVERTVSGHA